MSTNSPIAPTAVGTEIAPRRGWRTAAAITGLLGVVLLVLNFVGLAVPLRSPDVESYTDFAGSKTLAYDKAIAALSALAGSGTDKRSLVTGATRIFHAAMAHISPADVSRYGYEHYRMRVPPWENYLLWLLSYLKPDTYRDYEFCSYRKALERGIGRCGQQSLALVGFLAENGLDTGFVALGGHAIATARVDDGSWYLLDADYGGVIPFSIAEAEKDPVRVLDYYWNDAAARRGLHRNFGPEGNEIKYGGPRARWGRACPIETAAYVAKWAIPALLIAPALLVLASGFRRRRLPGDGL